MENYNIDVLLEKTNKSALGIRSRQTGITLKEYFLTQKDRAKNILKSQKEKINEALERASNISSDKKSSSTQSIIITNKAGKSEKRTLCVDGMTMQRVVSSLKKIAAELYGNLKYRVSQIVKLCDEGIKKSSLIIKGKTDIVAVNTAKNIKSDVSQYNSLLNASLSDMRNLFKAYYNATK